MPLKIRCDGKCKKFYKIFWELNKALLKLQFTVSRSCCFCASPLGRPCIADHNTNNGPSPSSSREHSTVSPSGLFFTSIGDWRRRLVARSRVCVCVCATVSSCHFCKEIRYSDQTSNPLLSNNPCVESRIENWLKIVTTASLLQGNPNCDAASGYISVWVYFNLCS